MMKIMLMVIVVIMHFFVIYSCGPELPKEDRMQMVIEEGIKQYNFRGASAAVIFPDGRIWTGVSGISHDTVGIKPDMLFAIGSITKNMLPRLRYIWSLVN